jgi:hypothetical protein
LLQGYSLDLTNCDTPERGWPALQVMPAGYYLLELEDIQVTFLTAFKDVLEGTFERDSIVRFTLTIFLKVWGKMCLQKVQ